MLTGNEVCIEGEGEGEGDNMLEIVVHEIRGKCPVYKVGDKIVIDDPEIVLERTDVLCIHAMR